MGIAARLKRLQAHAESRGPVVFEDDLEALAKPSGIALPPLSPDDVFPDDPKLRARAASYCAGLDCETCLIQPGRAVPRLVVTGYQNTDGTQEIVTGAPGGVRDVTAHARAFLAFTERLLREWALEQRPEVHYVGGLLINQNIAFDFSVVAEAAHQADVELGLVGHKDSWFERVMARIFEMLDVGIVEDTMLRERILDLAEGTLDRDFTSLTEKGNPRRKKYNLKVITKTYLGVDLDKFTFRLGYAQYLDRDISEYDPGARDYLTDDVEAALHSATRQQERAVANGLAPAARIPNSAEQARAAFALQLISSWGMRTSLSKVQQLDADLDKHSRGMLAVLKDAGIVRTTGRNAGTRDLKRTHELVEKAYKDAGLVVPRTPTGRVSTAGSVLEDIALLRVRGSLDDRLDENGQLDESDLFQDPLYCYSYFASIQKLQSTYLPVLYDGARYPINTRFETIRETGRISSFSPNLNNMPRGGTKTLLQRLQARVRQCFVPRDGYLYCSVDYNMLELVTLAQVLLWFFGESKMADAINEGFDLHTLFAAEQLLHITYEDALARKKDKDVADMRQLAKVGNFGLGGGMGAASLADFAKAAYGLYITEEEARDLKEKWLAQWPEMRAYFRLISSMMRGYDDRGDPVGDVEQFVSGRIRGRARYCATANTFFQGLAADLTKTVLYKIQKECYLLGGSMYGSRVVGYFYDEFFMEHPEDVAHERAGIQAQIAVEEGQQTVPDVKLKAAPALQRCWYKEADEVWDADGKKRVPWEPDVKYVKDPETGKMCVPRGGFLKHREDQERALAARSVVR